MKLEEFFIVALPGLEDVTANEIRFWYPDLEIAKEHGGLTVHAPLEVGLGFNLTLRTATRVLLRVARFSCRDFPKLFKKISTLPWETWLQRSTHIEVEASTRTSRLKIKKRIEETAHEGLRAWAGKNQGAVEKGSATVYVRLHNDECTVSLDTSGERLHKRGERTRIGEAPLRESIASALIRVVSEAAPAPDSVEIFDPMVGSGTFLLEAAGIGQMQARHDFAFRHFVNPEPSLPKAHVSLKPSLLVGIDADAKTLNAARENLSTIAKHLPVHLTKADVFSAEPIPKTAQERWLFCNPPYGERLKVKGPLMEFYQRLFKSCARVADPDRACFLLPSKAIKGKFDLPFGWKVAVKRPFLNGGIPVTAYVFLKTSAKPSAEQ